MSGRSPSETVFEIGSNRANGGETRRSSCEICRAVIVWKLEVTMRGRTVNIEIPSGRPRTGGANVGSGVPANADIGGE
jgi:hypothetical protein